MDDQYEDGTDAHAAGLGISSCPFAPADPAGQRWRLDWIAAEQRARVNAGTYGATDDQYRRAGLIPPERDMRGRPLPAGVTRDQVDAAVQMATDLAKALATTFEEAMRKIRDALNTSLPEIHRLAKILEGMNVETPAPTSPSRRHRPCPRHGPTDATAGMCRPCARGAR